MKANLFLTIFLVQVTSAFSCSLDEWSQLATSIENSSVLNSEDVIATGTLSYDLNELKRVVGECNKLKSNVGCYRGILQSRSREISRLEFTNLQCESLNEIHNILTGRE